MWAELEENPLLEEEAPEISLADSERKLDEKISLLIDDEEQEQDFFWAGEEKDKDWQNKSRYLENRMVTKDSLYSHLHWQLEVLAGDAEEKRIGEFIIGNLDEKGFLNMGPEKMRELLKVDRKSFKRVLRLVRSFDPAGIAAQNLKESLLLQLAASGVKDRQLYRIVYSHLEDLEKGYLEKIARTLSLSVAKVERAKKRLSYLNPRPAASFGQTETVFIVEPDVFLNRHNGTYDIEVNEENLPKIFINHRYRIILKDKNILPKTEEYIKLKLARGLWLLEAVAQRRKTITRVCGYLAEAQRDFLEKDDMALRPLTLRQVADTLSLSEATISRVVSNKYAQLNNNRIINLKDFFARRLKTQDGRFISDREVKKRIIDLIAQEDKNRPLTDNEITSLLNKEGIKISRRTVAKYRENLKIFPFNLRKSKPR